MAPLALAQAADPPATSLTLEACEQFDEAEIQRILNIELESLSVSGNGGELLIRLSCYSDGRVDITVEDRSRDKRLERSVIVPDPNHPGRERIVAIAASQLVIALDWLPEEPAAEAAPPLAATPKSDPEPGPEPTPLDADRQRGSISILMGGRARDLATPMLSARFALRGGAEVVDDCLALGSIAVETGSAEREAGHVHLLGGGVGLGLAVEFWRVSRLHLEAGGSIYASYLRLDGDARDERYRGRTSESFGAELELMAGPVIRAGAIELGAQLQLGVTLPAVRGLVESEQTVDLQGVWLGVALRAGIVIGE